MKKISMLILALLFTSCASPWKVRGGPDSCRKMCKDWNLEFTSMVGVGDQSESGGGATACVCQPKEILKTSSLPGASSSAASLSGSIVAAEAAAAAAAHMQAMRAAQIEHK